MDILLLVNGELHRPDILKERLGREAFDRVIAVDGGLRHAAALGVTADTLLGDLDSAAGADRGFPGDVVTYPPHKNETDLELALLHAAGLGAARIVLVGALGGRLDMTVSSIHLLLHPGLAGCRVEIWHGPETAWVIRAPGGPVFGRPGDLVSVLPLCAEVTGVNNRGMQYPLRGETLAFGHARGLSNVLTSEDAGLTFGAGEVLVVHCPAETQGGL